MPDSSRSITEWLDAFETCVRDERYDDARALFADDVHAFGTFAGNPVGLDQLVDRQWRHIWPRIDRFTFNRDAMRIDIDDAQTLAVVMTTWRTVGFDNQGNRFDRPGRVTIVLRRDDAAPHRVEGWVATHTHFSLEPGAAQTQSHRPGRTHAPDQAERP